MKKITLALAILGITAFAAHAQTVGSANILGYTKVDKPGNSKLNIMGVNFTSASNTLNNLVDPLTFSGHASDPASADQIIIWDSSLQEFDTYALYDLGSGYEEYTGWQAFDNFGWAKPYFNPALPAGSSVFIRGSSSDTNILLSGNVVMLDTITNTLHQGLHLIANPFSESVALTNLSLHISATGHANNPAYADQVIAWNKELQQYETYALYDLGSGYEQYKGWQDFDNFGWAKPYMNFTINTGDGFWFRAVNGSVEWVESNKYKNNL